MQNTIKYHGLTIHLEECRYDDFQGTYEVSLPTNLYRNLMKESEGTFYGDYLDECWKVETSDCFCSHDMLECDDCEHYEELPERISFANADAFIRLCYLIKYEDAKYDVYVAAPSFYWIYHDIAHTDLNHNPETGFDYRMEREAIILGTELAIKGGVPADVIVNELSHLGKTFEQRFKKSLSTCDYCE